MSELLDKINQQWAKNYAELEAINKELVGTADKTLAFLGCISELTPGHELYNRYGIDREELGELLSEAHTAIAKAKNEDEIKDDDLHPVLTSIRVMTR
jgi:hypothetical protein